eukprot:TRINITY_DN7834_c0_g1_i1.p1 TRINITY_DN7834_c0_g1~~TRINITY_DN7834_c0_g1_i1.p1  ORF type:complete len:122 (+),score=29.28 TRINITY_DN7834_c0_g1_i1:1335-1700(+)
MRMFLETVKVYEMALWQWYQRNLQLLRLYGQTLVQHQLMMLNANLREQDREEDKEVVSEDANRNLDDQKDIDKVKKADMKEEEELKLGDKHKEDYNEYNDAEDNISPDSMRSNSKDIKKYK